MADGTPNGVAIKLDIGCGKNKEAGWVGIDSLAFPGVDHIVDIGRDPWPFETGTVTEARAVHVLEHLTNYNGLWERVHFFNEACRVLVPGGKLLLAFPHWASCRYYGDPTHKEPFSEFGFYYLKREWRDTQGNAPHTESAYAPHMYTCNFEAVWGYAPHPSLATRSQEHQQFAFANYKESILDIHATLTKL